MAIRVGRETETKLSARLKKKLFKGLDFFQINIIFIIKFKRIMNSLFRLHGIEEPRQHGYEQYPGFGPRVGIFGVVD